MVLDDILGNVTARVAPVAGSARQIVEDSAVEATGKAAAVTTKAGASPALASALIALAALGAIVGMRFAFRGAIS